jgi:hypothetical protein
MPRGKNINSLANLRMFSKDFRPEKTGKTPGTRNTKGGNARRNRRGRTGYSSEKNKEGNAVLPAVYWVAVCRNGY